MINSRKAEDAIENLEVSVAVCQQIAIDLGAAFSVHAAELACMEKASSYHELMDALAGMRESGAIKLCSRHARDLAAALNGTEIEAQKMNGAVIGLIKELSKKIDGGDSSSDTE